MKIVGLTGGIGSGKSTVAKIFNALGHPVFNSDIVAKKCYHQVSCRTRIEQLLGEGVYHGDSVNFKAVSQIVFNEPAKLKALNEIIHPCVQEQFVKWTSLQRGTFVIKEAAILIESGAFKNCDFIISVEASEAIRTQRVVKRDGVNVRDVQARMAQQFSSEQRSHYADYVIWNENDFLIPQILELIQKIEN